MNLYVGFAGGITHRLHRGKLISLMVKILYSDNSRPEDFSVSSENDETSSDSSPNSSNVVFYISPAFYGF